MIFFLTSCSYKLYVKENESGRRELKTKKFANKFEPSMLNDFDYEKIYYSYYEDKSIKFITHTYLRFFPDGQYAMFYEKSDKNVELNNLAAASHAGYYVVNENVLKLETPTGNGNTLGYRIIQNYHIKNDSLIQFKSKRGNDTLIQRDFPAILNVSPDW